MIKKDYYEVLAVSKDSDEKTIKSAYRRLALQYHPDKNPGDKVAEERFKEASEAYEVLCDPEKRQVYDRFGHRGLEGAGFHGFTDVEDVFGSFGDIFEDFFGFSGGGSRKNRPRHGADLRYDLEIDFMEACFGSEKQINVVKDTVCEECEGSGARKGSQPVTCQQCAGFGQIRHTQGFFTISTTCPNCHGVGTRVADPCKECQGQGKVRKNKKLTVKIPPGVDTGIRLMITAEGEAGQRGGQAGNLYVFLSVKPHDVFKRDGDDVHCTLSVSMVQASLGDKIKVPTLKGEEEVAIPKGIQSGETLILKGHGVPNLRSKKPGNQIISVAVQTPTNLSREQEELLKRFGELTPSGPDTQVDGKKKSKKHGLFG